MLVYLIRRLGQSLLVVAVMATLVFVAMYAVGDPVDILASPDTDQIERDAIARRLGLDRPLWEQFGVFLWNALHGDLGRSFVYNAPAVDVILQRLPASVGGATVSVLGVPLAILTWDGLKHLILPALTLALYKSALVVRIAQAGTRETMLQDYIRFARAKGLSRPRIVGVHVMKNILIPIVTVLGLEL